MTDRPHLHPSSLGITITIDRPSSARLLSRLSASAGLAVSTLAEPAKPAKKAIQISATPGWMGRYEVDQARLEITDRMLGHLSSCMTRQGWLYGLHGRCTCGMNWRCDKRKLIRDLAGAVRQVLHEMMRPRHLARTRGRRRRR